MSNSNCRYPSLVSFALLPFCCVVSAVDAQDSMELPPKESLVAMEALDLEVSLAIATCYDTIAADPFRKDVSKWSKALKPEPGAFQAIERRYHQVKTKHPDSTVRPIIVYQELTQFRPQGRQFVVSETSTHLEMPTKWTEMKEFLSARGKPSFHAVDNTRPSTYGPVLCVERLVQRRSKVVPVDMAISKEVLVRVTWEILPSDGASVLQSDELITAWSNGGWREKD